MRKSEIMRILLNRSKALRSQFSDDGEFSQMMQRYADVHNAMFEQQIHEQEIAELQEAASASSDDDIFSVNIRSEVKTK